MFKLYPNMYLAVITVFVFLSGCTFPLDPGAGKDAIPRYYFKRGTFTCEPFIYTGFLGNPNNFETLSACQQECEES